MKTGVEIVTGFIGAGKTTFIRTLVEQTLVSGERVLILQMESGNQKLESWIQSCNGRVMLRSWTEITSQSAVQLKNMILLLNPHRIIMEHNGSRELWRLLSLLRGKPLRRLLRIKSIYHLADAAGYKRLLQNTGDILSSQVSQSDLVILHGMGGLSQEERTELQRMIRNLCHEGYILSVMDISHLPAALKSESLLEQGLLRRYSVYLENYL